MDALPPPSSPTRTSSLKLRSQLLLHLSRLNTHIEHLNHLTLSTPSLDALLCTTTYTLTLLSTLLPLFPTPKLPTTISTKSTLPTAPTPLIHLPPLLLHLSTLRLSLRLWGLLPIYTSLLALLRHPPRDRILRSLAYLNLALGTAFQILENIAFLGDLGVLRVGERKRARYWLWSGRFWMGGVGGEGVRLWREWVLERRRREGKEGEGGKEVVAEKEEKIQRRRESERWWRQVMANAAWAPLTLHWSVEGGVLGEGAVGALGMLAGGVALREAWRGG